MNNELNITGLKHGGMLGGLAAIVLFLLILISRDLYMALSGLGVPTVVFGLLIFLGMKERREQYDNDLNYMAAFVYASIALFVANNISNFANITIIKYMDPEIQNIMLNEGMAEAEEMFRMIGTSELEIDKQMMNLENQLKASFSYMSMLTNSWAPLISALFCGAIAALFIRKNKPDFAEE